MEPRAKFLHESRKTAVRQEAVPDMEDSPPVSDSDEQESVRAVPESSAAPLLDVFSSMLKDTTSQHRAHLFDLNCKICTGQVPSSEDEPAPKRQKPSASKKEEPKPKHDSPPPSEPAVSSADELVPETVPEAASEPDPGGAFEAPLERKCPPGPPGDSHPEPSTLEGPSGLASCGGGVLTTVTMSGRDPRTAQSGASTVTTPAAAHSEPAPLAEPRQDVPKPSVASVLVPKSILAKPSSSPEPRYLLSVPPSPSIRCGVPAWSSMAHVVEQEGRPRGGHLHSTAPEHPSACEAPGARVGAPGTIQKARSGWGNARSQPSGFGACSASFSLSRTSVDSVVVW